MRNPCIVIGNGPSLKDVPLEFLRKYQTFGTNKIYLLEGFTPTYYVCVNPLVLAQNKDIINGLSCARYVMEGYGVDGIQLTRSTRMPFSENPIVWVNEGYTVTYVCLQLAFWMDFDPVLLVGVDHRYRFEGKPNERRKFSGKDVNHFDSRYFTGQEWNNPDLDKSRLYYQIAEDVYRAHGRRIINLTPGSALDVFEKGELEEWQ